MADPETRHEIDARMSGRDSNPGTAQTAHPTPHTSGGRDPAGERRAHQQTRRRRIAIIAAVVLVVLLVFQGIGSVIATWAVNRKLAELAQYQGRVGSVRLEWWRGAVAVRDFVFRSRGPQDDPPILHVRQGRLTLAPSVLVRGRLGGSAVVDGLELNFVKRERFDGPVEAVQRIGDKAEEKTEEAARWQDVLKDAIPMELTRLEVRNGQARFIDPTQEPRVEVGLKNFEITAVGLRNRPAPRERLPAHVRLHGVTTGAGQLDLEVRADPAEEPFRFTTTCELRDLNLPDVNPMMRAYTGMDVARGTFDFYLQVHAEGGGYRGRTKPFFQDLEFENLGDRNKPVLQRWTESAVDAVSGLLENQQTDKVATGVPISGTFKQGEADVWTAAGNLLRNAFIEAIREGFTNQEGG